MDYVTLSNLVNRPSRDNGARRTAEQATADIHRLAEWTRGELKRIEAQALRRDGWTIKDVADRLGVTEYRVRKWGK